MLETENLYLRAVEPDDLSVLYLWENTPEHWSYSDLMGPFSYHTLKAFIESASNVQENGQTRLMLVSKAQNKSIGCIDIYEIDFVNQRAGVGVLIADKDYRKKGYATEALSKCLEYAGRTLNLNQLYCDILASNGVSIKLFKSLGFREIGVKKQWKRAGKEFQDVLLFQKLLHEG